MVHANGTKELLLQLLLQLLHQLPDVPLQLILQHQCVIFHLNQLQAPLLLLSQPMMFHHTGLILLALSFAQLVEA
jgi:hypothetical protein